MKAVELPARAIERVLASAAAHQVRLALDVKIISTRRILFCIENQE
jgi:hypothetical protein